MGANCDLYMLKITAGKNARHSDIKFTLNLMSFVSYHLCCAVRFHHAQLVTELEKEPVSMLTMKLCQFSLFYIYAIIYVTKFWESIPNQTLEAMR